MKKIDHMINCWTLVKSSPPQEVIGALNFSSSLPGWSHTLQRENYLAHGRIITWYEINPQPQKSGHYGSREIRQLEHIFRECAILCGRPQAVQGVNSGGLTGLMQGLYNTVRIREDLAIMQRFHMALRAQRMAIARIKF